MIEFCEENPEGTYEDLLNRIEVNILFQYHRRVLIQPSQRSNIYVGKFACILCISGSAFYVINYV